MNTSPTRLQTDGQQRIVQIVHITQGCGKKQLNKYEPASCGEQHGNDKPVGFASEHASGRAVCSSGALCFFHI